MTASGNAQPTEAASNGDTSPPPTWRFWLSAAQPLLLAVAAVFACANTPHLWGAHWTQVVLVICAWVSTLLFIASQAWVRFRQRNRQAPDAQRARLMGPWLLLVLFNVTLLLLPFTDLLFRVTFHASLPDLRAAAESDEFFPHAGWFVGAIRQETDSGVLLTIQWDDNSNMSLLNSLDETFTKKEITLHARDTKGRVSDSGPCPIRTTKRLADNWYLVYWSSPDAENAGDVSPP